MEGSRAMEHKSDEIEPEIVGDDENLSAITTDTTGHIADSTLHERYEEAVESSQFLGNNLNRGDLTQFLADISENKTLLDVVPQRTYSPADSFLSIPDDSPSVQGSVVSSPGGSFKLRSTRYRSDLESPTPSFRPFDRRFHSRLSSPSYSALKASSSSYQSLPQNTSTNSDSSCSSSRRSRSKNRPESRDNETPSPPWDAVRWTKLNKINIQAFSEVPKASSPNHSREIADGRKIKAVEAGPLTSIVISADHLVVAGGHANGSIFTWEISRAAYPFLHIPSLDPTQLLNRNIDGHMLNVAVRHLGFLGMRHTALVSADDRGMAFTHVATRGLGSISRTVKSTRILGRYPNDTPGTGKPRTPSTVFACAPLPLGNVERGSDTMGLTALLTPHLLVIISTTPVAQTQYKTGRPKDIDHQCPLSGHLAWFPAVKLKFPDPETGRDVSLIKLAYCWSNILTILDIDEIESADGLSSLSFNPRSRWKSEEAIVAVQWLSRSLLTLLTTSQRLIVLEDGTMRVTEVFDLLNKHIFYQDIFSKPLMTYLEQLKHNNTLTMSTPVADAYYMSFKVYKRRFFLLGFNYVLIGTLSDWTDRLATIMQYDDYIGAIRLATSYYIGDADKIMIGLPADSDSRHSIVQDKLVEIIKTSLKYAFNQDNKNLQSKITCNHLEDLAEACVEACLSIDDMDFLFDEVYEWYNDGDSDENFIKILEPKILEKRITVIPPAVVKRIIIYFVNKGLESRLEEIICHIKPSCLDIDQVTLLCKKHNLFDALIYVWNQALSDYITPLIELFKLLVPLAQHENFTTNRYLMENHIGPNATKIFPYLSYTLTGRIYPTGEPLGNQEIHKGKSELYWFLFSGDTSKWSNVSEIPILSQLTQTFNPSFPYLRMVLRFDAPSFLSVMNEAFEDSFLNDISGQRVNGGSKMALASPRDEVFDVSVNRQYIITILLEVMNPSDFASEDMIYLDMFIARNLPKFPQYILLPSSCLHNILIRLCNFPSPEIADDAQLSVEYLLSVYRPSDLPSLMSLFQRAGFYRVLKSIYKSEKQYSKLLYTHFEDTQDLSAVFDCISDCLRPRPSLMRRQLEEIHKIILTHAVDLLHIDVVRTAQTIDSLAPELHQRFLEAIKEELELQFIYLRTIVEPDTSKERESKLPVEFLEQYVQLMCKFDSLRVVTYVEKVQVGDLRLDQILPFMEESGVVDAAVLLMTRNGQFEDAMNRLMRHLKNLESAALGILTSSVEEVRLANGDDALKDLLESLKKYTNVGIWLCESQTKLESRHISSDQRKAASKNYHLLPEETLWLDLIDLSIQMTRNLSMNFENSCGLHLYWQTQRDEILAQLRTPVQCIFSALLTMTCNHTSSQISISFIRILRAFLTRASVSSPNLSDLRAVLASIFSTYNYEERILKLINRLLEKDLFFNVQTAINLRQRGWRPRRSTCEGCGRRIWGPGVSGDICSKWEDREMIDLKRRRERISELAGGGYIERGKAPAHHHRCTTNSLLVRGDPLSVGVGNQNLDEENKNEDNFYINNETGGYDDYKKRGQIHSKEHDLGPLVVLACRHAYHQSCLEKIQGENASILEGREFKCPIDGQQ